MKHSLVAADEMLLHSCGVSALISWQECHLNHGMLTLVLCHVGKRYYYVSKEMHSHRCRHHLLSSKAFAPWREEEVLVLEMPLFISSSSSSFFSLNCQFTTYY